MVQERRDEHSEGPEKDQGSAEALRKELLKLVVGASSSSEADAALTKSHRKMRNRKAMRQLGIKTTAVLDSVMSDRGSQQRRSSKKKRRKRKGMGARLKVSASLPALSGNTFAAGNVHFDMR